MNMRVVPMADEAIALASARAVLRRPEEAGAAELRAACEYLRRQGDWIDVVRADAMLDRLDQEEHWIEPDPADPVEAAELGRLFAEAGQRMEEVHGAQPSRAAEIARDVIEGGLIVALFLGVWAHALGWGLVP